MAAEAIVAEGVLADVDGAGVAASESAVDFLEGGVPMSSSDSGLSRVTFFVFVEILSGNSDSMMYEKSRDCVSRLR